MKIMQFLNYIKNNKISKRIFSFIFPNYCVFCDKTTIDNALFCENHYKKIIFNSFPNCVICSKPITGNNDRTTCLDCLNNKPSYDLSLVLFNYNKQIAQLILKLKYNDDTSFLRKTATIINGNLSTQEYHLIIPVPLHKKRLKKRKYNQSSLLASEISKLSGLNYIPNLLIRQKFTSSQEGLNKKQRLENVKDSFKINPKYQDKIKDLNIILVDDVIASGATVENCSKLLKKSKCNRILVVAIAISG